MNEFYDEDVHPIEVRASFTAHSTEELKQLAAIGGIKPKRRGRSNKEKWEQTVSDAFVVLPIEEMKRARGTSAHNACRLIAARLHRRVSWSTHWKRYLRAKKRNRFTHSTLRQFLLEFRRDFK